jgi:hypothetical protein
MSLRTIANFVASEAGVPYTTDADKAYLHDRINKAAEELYINNDLPHVLQELYMSLNANVSEIFTLPPYVAKLRGLRRPHYDGKNALTFTGIVPRYQKQAWGNISLDNIRVVGEVATGRDINEEQDITIQLSRVQSTDVTIVLTGDTAEEQGYIEEVTILAGELSTTFSSVFTQINSAVKTPFFFGAVKAFEELAPGAPLFEILAAQVRSNYVKVQIQDLYMFRVTSGQYNFELLYKPKLPLMYSPNSEFIVPEIYDQCIAWWTISQYVKSGDDAQMYLAKVATKLANINEDEKRGRKEKFNIGYNNAAETYDRLTWMF